jgi:oligopeptide/dipeptide ABC transporter ATP-binding protein
VDDLLDVRDLKTWFTTEEGTIRAVNGVSFALRRGGSVGIVGESGCGKSVTALSVMSLIPRPRCRIAGGSILYHRTADEAVDIARLDPGGDEIRSIRGNEIAMIFQEPMTSLNPIYSVGRQIAEAVQLHQHVDRADARERAVEMLDRVGIAGPRQRVNEYPHQMSGGMRQRVMIAMALSCEPHLLIADEPTTALDVTIEAQILDLIRRLQEENDMALVMITHDLGVIAEMAERTIVMYMGMIVESGMTNDVFARPAHPYTQALRRSIPRIGSKERLVSIEGSIPNPYNLPQGCPFAPRCAHAMEVCRRACPPTIRVADDQSCMCWLHVAEFERRNALRDHAPRDQGARP